MSIMLYMEGNGTSGMHSLSDEVLLEICAYLSSEDLLSLSQTSIKFNDLLCDRLLMREVNFRAAYSLTIDKIKLFLQPKIRCQNIHTLSLSSCYWLTSTDIFWAVKRLNGLENLHVDDTELSINHLISILSSKKKIRSLSWTFNMTNKDGSKDVYSLAKNFLEMKSLNLWVNYVGVHYLTVLLQHCTSLEGLRLSSSRCETLDHGMYGRYMGVFQLPCLKSLVLNLPETSSSAWIAFIHLLFHACGTIRFWHTFWLDCNPFFLRAEGSRNIEAFRPFEKFGSAYALSNPLLNDWDLMLMKNIKYFVFERKYPCNLSSDLGRSEISHLVWRCDFWPECFPTQLQHLCIKCVHFVSYERLANTSLTLEPLMNLTTLSAPACIFLRSLGVRGKEEKDAFSAKGEGRQSLINKEPDKSCILNQFLRVAPNLKHFKLTCEGSTYCYYNGPRTVEIVNLLVIKQWTQLESLFLENMTVVDISPLFQICSCFPKLRRLGLRNIGIHGTYPRSRELGQAIIKLELLEDFRFEHPVVEKLSDIYEALSQKSKMRRIAILCERTNVKQNIQGVVDIVKKCPLLTFLYIRLPSFTQNDCKEFQKSVKTMYKNKHNRLWARIEGSSGNSILETCPKIHFSEMIKSNHLTIIPPLLYKDT